MMTTPSNTAIRKISKGFPMPLTALSPLDNRYTSRLTDLIPCLSHFALIAYRVQIEIEWLRFQSEHPALTHVPRIYRC